MDKSATLRPRIGSPTADNQVLDSDTLSPKIRKVLLGSFRWMDEPPRRERLNFVKFSPELSMDKSVTLRPNIGSPTADNQVLDSDTLSPKIRNVLLGSYRWPSCIESQWVSSHKFGEFSSVAFDGRIAEARKTKIRQVFLGSLSMAIVHRKSVGVKPQIR